MTRRKAVIVDLDGTISSSLWRQHLIGDPPDWHRFHLHCTMDAPIAEVIEEVHSWYARPNHDVLLLTARTETYRYHTQWWLMEHGLRYTRLFMRPKGDQRRASVQKADLYDRQIAPHWDVVHAYEDNMTVVEQWALREIPVTVCQDPGLDPIERAGPSTADVV